MSYIAPSTRLGWRLLPGIVAAAAAVIGASLVIGALRVQPVTFTRGASDAIADPGLVNAPWRTEAVAVGAGRKLTKAERARFAHQRDRVRGTVRDLADAIALHPGAQLPAVARRAMTGVAAGSLLKQAPSVPKGAHDLEIVERGGDLGIQAPGFRAAVAQMHVVMRATIEQRSIKWRDDYTFWLQRSHGRWRVMSFGLDRTQR